MTHQPSESEHVASMEDVCKLCNLKRLDHGDSNHRFSMDGTLTPLQAGPKPQMDAPKKRAGDEDEHSSNEKLAQSMELNAVLRLTEILIEKGIIDGKETMYIFSGHKS